MSTELTKYEPILKLLKENEGKLQVFLTADEKVRRYKYRLKGKKTSRTIFLSEQLQFLLKEYCIENDLKIGLVVETAIIEHLNRNGMDKKLLEILQAPITPSEDEGKQGKNPNVQGKQGESAGEI